ncbi:MAG: hypothetical protein KAT91_00280 [Candidatus Aenigmarchaeota archaeon]|nr:hypothetical protein [Candidatus Aenigmarchaeota archaeon]
MNYHKYAVREKMKQRIAELRKQYPYKTSPRNEGQIQLSNYGNTAAVC